MITNFDHIHLYTADLESTRRFYEETLGAEAVGQLPNNHGGHNHLILLGGQFLAISAYPAGMHPSEPPAHADGALTHGFGVAHLGLNVDKLDPMIDRLEAAGVRVHSRPRGSGAIRYVYFTAPDGVVVELTEYVLPLKLRAGAAALKVFNRGVHRARLAIGKALIKGAN
jgi:catechol 2,3-dioxygenase-like lactoylglutathione lyase family enzyme